MSDTSVPIVITEAGLQPQSPASLNAQLIALALSLEPGLTVNLPGSMIEDVASTDTAALILCDQALVEFVNSLTPLGANPFLANQLGQVYGVVQGLATNTSVYVVFTTSPAAPGFVIPEGFTVSDGSYQYVIQDGGIIPSSGVSDPLYALAVSTGSWAVPANTVTQIITSVPSTVSMAVTNPEAGTPQAAPQTLEQYREQVLQAGLAASQGMATYLKTLLGQVPGVQPNLVSVMQQPGVGWEVICGGGDPYQVAYAIYQALFDINSLVGSTLAVTNITVANPGVVTTNLNHGLTTGQTIYINGVVGMTEINGVPLTVMVVDEKNFSIGSTSTYSAYVSGGVVTPNPRNISVSIQDYPDTYVIPFVNPPQQTVAMTVTWNTISSNFVSGAAVAQLGAPALAAYVNALAVGVPMNLFELQTTFQAAIASVLAPQLLTRMLFAVSINGIPTSPESGTGIIAGDPESYFYTTNSAITILQG